MKRVLIVVLLVFLLVIISPVSAVIKACLACNSTCNTLPGEANMTANMTMNQTIIAIINDSYYLRDNSLPLTSEKVRRDVDNDLLSLYGGNAIAGGTGIISLYGKTSGNPNAVEIVVGDSVEVGNVLVTGWKGGVAPLMDMKGYNITGIKTITADSDAVNKSYMISQINSSPVSSGNDPTAKSTTLIVSDFYDPGVNNAVPGLAGAAISSGTAAVVATTANHPGVIYMRDSTTALGGYRYGCNGRQLIGGGETFEVVFQPVGVRAGQRSQMGWSDTAAAGVQPVDGIFFNITGSGSALTLRGNTSSKSVRSGTLTTYTPTPATWYRGTIVVNAAGTLVTYTLYSEAGETLWTDTVATNIPTGAGRDTSPCIIVSEYTTDAAADIVRLDYVKWATTRTLTR